MTSTSTPGGEEDLFRPLPDALRELISSLEWPPADAYPTLPDWARALVYATSEFTVDLKELRPFELGGRSGGDEASVVIAFEGVCLELSPGGQSMTFIATPPAQEQAEWLLPKVSDYWDARVGAIEAGGKRLGELDSEEREAAGVAIERSVSEHVRALDDGMLVVSAVSLFDDLYKTASSIGYWDEDLRQYLVASCGTFCTLLSERGFRVQYLIDNAWEDLSRPIQLFPDWYRAAGISYCCPQALAPELARHDGFDPDSDLTELLPRYIDEARHAGDMLVTKCRDEREHLVQLDTDMVGTSFDNALEARADEGVLTVHRCEAPEPGSKIDIFPPKGITYPRA